MQLIDLTCSSCGAVMKVNAELKQCACNFCGKVMFITEEIQKHEFVNGYTYGYDLEKGRLQAQEDYKLEQERKEIERKEKERLEALRRAEEEARRLKEDQKKEVIKWSKISGGVFLFGIILLCGEASRTFGVFVIVTAIGLLCYKAYYIYNPQQTRNVGTTGYSVQMLKFPGFWYPFSDKSYLEVYNHLLDIGFNNVRVTNLHDIKIGLLKREGSIETILVAGSRVGAGGGRYPANIPIEIIYHGK